VGHFCFAVTGVINAIGSRELPRIGFFYSLFVVIGFDDGFVIIGFVTVIAVIGADVGDSVVSAGIIRVTV
jgi:hypothetical protein